MTIIPEDVNVNDNEGGGSTPVDAYTKMEVDTLLAKKFELTGNNTISGENSFYATQNFNTQVGLFGLMRVMDGGVLRATTGKILIDNAPTEDTQAANKKYVDDTVAAAGGSSDAYTKQESDNKYFPKSGGYINGAVWVTGGINITGDSNINGRLITDSAEGFKAWNGKAYNFLSTTGVNANNLTVTNALTCNAPASFNQAVTLGVEPTADNMPATKKYVDDSIASSGAAAVHLLTHIRKVNPICDMRSWMDIIIFQGKIPFWVV